MPGEKAIQIARECISSDFAGRAEIIQAAIDEAVELADRKAREECAEIAEQTSGEYGKYGAMAWPVSACQDIRLKIRATIAARGEKAEEQR